MNGLSEFQQQAAVVALVKMLRARSFNICDLDNLAKLLDCSSAMAGKDYQALRSLHCVDYADMGPDLAQQVRHKSAELLGLLPQVVDAEFKDVQTQPAHPSASKLRLAFWK